MVAVSKRYQHGLASGSPGAGITSQRFSAYAGHLHAQVNSLNHSPSQSSLYSRSHSHFHYVCVCISIISRTPQKCQPNEKDISPFGFVYSNATLHWFHSFQSNVETNKLFLLLFCCCFCCQLKTPRYSVRAATQNGFRLPPWSGPIE